MIDGYTYNNPHLFKSDYQVKYSSQTGWCLFSTNTKTEKPKKLESKLCIS